MMTSKSVPGCRRSRRISLVVLPTCPATPARLNNSARAKLSTDRDSTIVATSTAELKASCVDSVAVGYRRATSQRVHLDDIGISPPGPECRLELPLIGSEAGSSALGGKSVSSRLCRQLCCQNNAVTMAMPAAAIDALSCGL